MAHYCGAELNISLFLFISCLTTIAAAIRSQEIYSTLEARGKNSQKVLGSVVGILTFLEHQEKTTKFVKRPLAYDLF